MRGVEAANIHTRNGIRCRYKREQRDDQLHCTTALSLAHKARYSRKVLTNAVR